MLSVEIVEEINWKTFCGNPIEIIIRKSFINNYENILLGITLKKVGHGCEYLVYILFRSKKSQTQIIIWNLYGLVETNKFSDKRQNNLFKPPIRT